MRGTIMIAAAALGLGGTGCFASWIGVQASGSARILEEGAREVSVPMPGVREVLAVHLPLAGSDVLELGCETIQRAKNTVHRTAFRYGKKWKYAAATMFVVEAAVATATYFGNRDNPQNQLVGGVVALDAIGTAALFFAPRKELYRTEERPVSNRVRTDCPEGLALDIGGEVYPVDAAGRIGELGAAALDTWMQAPGAPIRISYAGQTADVPIGQPEQCAWNESHHPAAASPAAPATPADPANPASPAGPADPANPASPAAAATPAPTTAAAPAGPSTQRPICPRYGPLPPSQVSASIEVPMGTLTRADETAAAPVAP
jgi:hypothetical protein